jgi:hypothetical protein
VFSLLQVSSAFARCTPFLEWIRVRRRGRSPHPPTCLSSRQALPPLGGRGVAASLQEIIVSESSPCFGWYKEGESIDLKGQWDVLVP